MSRWRWLPAILCGLVALVACSRPASSEETPAVVFSATPSVTFSAVPTQDYPPRSSTPTRTPRRLPTVAPSATVTPSPTEPQPTARPILGVGELGSLGLQMQWGRGAVGQLAVSPDGKTLALGTRGGIILYNTVTYAEINFIQTPSRPNCLVFSPDGRWLAVGLENGRAVGWRIGQYGHTAFELAGESGAIFSITFSPDSSMLAMGDFQTLFVWQFVNDKPAEKPLVKVKAHDQAVRALDFTLDGKYLLSAGGDGILRVWTVRSGKLYRTMYGHKTQIFSAGYAPASVEKGYGGLIASTSSDGRLCIWLASNGNLLREFSAHEVAIWRVVFSPDGRWLLTAAEDGTLRLWQMPTTRQLVDESKKSPGKALPYREIDLDGRAYSAAFSPDGAWLAAASPEVGLVRFWDVRPEAPQVLADLPGFLGSFSSAVISPDGNLAAVGLRRQVELWDPSNGTLQHSLKGEFNWIFALAFSPDGSLLASAGGDHRITLWRTSDGQRLNTLEGHNDWVWTVAFSPSGRLLASGSQDGTLRLWRAWPPENAGPERILQSGRRSVLRVAFSPDSLRLAASFVDGTLEVYNVLDGALLYSLQGHSGSVYALAFSPDGDLLASGSSDGRVNVWRVSSGALLNSFQFDSWADFIFFIPSGQALGVAGGSEGLVRFYTPEGTPLSRLPEIGAPLAGASMDTAGRRLLLATLDGRIFIYGLP